MGFLDIFKKKETKRKNENLGIRVAVLEVEVKKLYDAIYNSRPLNTLRPEPVSKSRKISESRKNRIASQLKTMDIIWNTNEKLSDLETARLLGISTSMLSKYRLFKYLPNEIMEIYKKGEFSGVTVLSELVSIKDRDKQIEMANKCRFKCYDESVVMLREYKKKHPELCRTRKHHKQYNRQYI